MLPNSNFISICLIFYFLNLDLVGEKELAVEVSAAKWQFDENLMPATQTSANFSFSQKNLIQIQMKKKTNTNTNTNQFTSRQNLGTASQRGFFIFLTDQAHTKWVCSYHHIEPGCLCCFQKFFTAIRGWKTYFSGLFAGCLWHFPEAQNQKATFMFVFRKKHPSKHTGHYSLYHTIVWYSLYHTIGNIWSWMFEQCFVKPRHKYMLSQLVQLGELSWQ